MKTEIKKGDFITIPFTICFQAEVISISDTRFRWQMLDTIEAVAKSWRAQLDKETQSFAEQFIKACHMEEPENAHEDSTR